MKKNLIAICLVLLSTVVYATDRTPLDVVQSIGDKLIRTTPFKNRLVVAPNRETFNHLKFVDFGRTFGLGKPGIAYALTTVYASENTELNIQLDHNDRCLIWLNGAEIYQKEHPKNLKLAHEERSIELSEKLTLSLKKGYNNLLVQSETTGTSWLFYIQPEPDKGAVKHGIKPDVRITLEGLPLIDPQVTKLTSWLVCGPFEAPINHSKLVSSEWGEMYTSGITTSWTIPKIEILGDVIDPTPWGTNYNWNYHNGGVAWAMQVLAEVSGKETYARYASDFCNFHLKNKLFIQYQIDQLNAFQCANHHIYATPLLDFTLAPSLPFVYRLNQESSFPMRNQYEAFVNRMIDYGKNEQVRLPGANIYTRLTPEVYTTWVDDMFMGIPFLVQASLYTGDKHYIQDAASQILEFNKQVWDSEAQLYMHAKYSAREVKLPHWTRANGWGLWATTEVLLHLPKNDKKYKQILKHYRKHIQSLVKYQNENGFWYNVLEYPESREEVSGTAIITMAIARGIRMGWLNEKQYKSVAEKAWNALKTQIEKDGTVYNICYGTMCSEDVAYYINRPFYTDDTHGLFAVLFAGIEMHKMQHEK